MEELKDKGTGDAPEASEDEAPTGRKIRLSKRTVIIALSGFIVLVLIAAAAFAYRSHVQEQEAVAAQKKERLAREAAVEAAALEQAEVAKEQAKEARRAHEAVMSASPSASELALPSSKEAEAQDKAAPPEPVTKTLAPVSEKAKAAALKPRPSSEAEPAKAAGGAPEGEGEKGASPAKTLGVNAPSAAGGCSVTGSSAEDYGKALSRCLEEFNRLEGRKP